MDEEVLRAKVGGVPTLVLVNPNQFNKYPQPPMGLALIAAVVEKAGYQVSILDANALNLSPEELPPLVKEADIIGLTAMTPSINMAMAVARQLKQTYPTRPIVLGGAHASLLPEETLAAAPEIDILVCGEGEETILALLHALQENKPLCQVCGISYRENSKIVHNSLSSELIDLDSLPFLAYHLLPWRKYRPHPPHGRALPFGAVITSRGCPYHCSYCSKPIFGNKFRFQSPERVVAEVAYLQQRFDIKEFCFYDDIFTLNRKRAYAIADEIIKRGLKFHWTCEARVNLVDKELLQHLKRAGCYSIAYGIESGSQEILNILDKGTGIEQIVEAVSLTRQVGMQCIGYFMIGSPGETPETVRQTIDFAKKLKLDYAQFAVTTPFPGTKLYELYRGSQNTVDIPWESFIYAGSGGANAPVFESDRLKREDIQNWTQQAYREFYFRPAYIWQRLTHLTSLGDLKMGLKGLSTLLGNASLYRRKKP